MQDYMFVNRTRASHSTLRQSATIIIIYSTKLLAIEYKKRGKISVSFLYLVFQEQSKRTHARYEFIT